MGHGYTGGKNINLTLDNNDQFGWAVSLDNNSLAVGAPYDDGFGNSKNDSGAVYLYSFSDNTFSGGALQGIIGHGYTGGKNINLTLDIADLLEALFLLITTGLSLGLIRMTGAAIYTQIQALFIFIPSLAVYSQAEILKL
ncbi:MAG: FG-GAP repeat protein [Sphingobacterium sp.]|nr:FG-GAP repeat protein [Sphingobacterium sp.]